MKTLSIVATVALALLVTACDVERKDANTVEISTDTAATAAAAEQTRDAAQATETALRDAAQATETAVRDAAQATETAAREGGAPLSQLQVDALNCLERLTYELAFEFTLDPGEIYLLNNYIVLHARTAFENWPEPEKARLLLRLWLTADDWRALDPRINATRSGIAAQEGKLPSFERSFGSGRMATQRS